jgi:hypothetical protein
MVEREVEQLSGRTGPAMQQSCVESGIVPADRDGNKADLVVLMLVRPT